jgi:hypothetical protein
MIVESIQSVYTITPLYSQQEVIKTMLDPKTDKTYQEFVTYKIYNSLGQEETSYRPKIDVQA